MEELVRNFAEGQVSRRVFIRRLIGTGATLAGATTIANLIQADPAAAAASCVGDVHMLADYALSPATLTLRPLGGGVCWIWDFAAASHTVTDTTGLGLYDSSPNPQAWGGWDWVTSYSRDFTAAGTWTYHCKDEYHSVDLAMPTEGRVKVPMKLSKKSILVGDRLRVSWAQADLGAGTLVFDVEVREPGDGWKSWKKGVTDSSSSFKASVPGRHKFRARMRDEGTGQSCGWSPVATFAAK